MGGGTGELCTCYLPHWSSLNREEGGRERESEKERERENRINLLCVLLSLAEVPLDP